MRYGGLAQPASFNGGMFGSLNKIAKEDFWVDGFYMLLWWGGTGCFSRRCDLDVFTLAFSWVHKLYTATGKLVNIGDLLFRDPKLRIDFIYNSCCFMFQITERSPYPARALSSIIYSAG